MRRTAIHFSLALAATLFVAAPATAMDIDWFGGLRLSDGDRNFLSISAAHFGSDRDDSHRLATRLQHPESDLPVVLFLAAESGRSTSFILDLRLGGLTWWDVRARLGVAPERVVMALPRDPGPPYGKAWGHYRNHPKNKNKGTAVVLSDREFCDWVGARVVSQAYGVDLVAVLESRSQGRSMGDVVTYHEKNHGNGHKKAHTTSQSASGKSESQAAGSQGRSKGKGAGKGKSRP